MSHLLEVRDVHGGYHKTEIVHGVSFTVEHGEFVCIIGANGCGQDDYLEDRLGAYEADRRRGAHRRKERA